MKKTMLLSMLLMVAVTVSLLAQDLKEKDIPQVVKTSFAKKYPDVKKANWEKEKGNFEANWGGKSGEDHSAVFTPAGSFVEIVDVIPVDHLPASVASYVKKHYKGARITEAGKVTDAAGKHMFEAEIHGKDLIFDEKGVFIRQD
ncbi:MAG: hypothetical protein NVS3B15_02790 [Sediminibacterium sp.]